MKTQTRRWKSINRLGEWGSKKNRKGVFFGPGQRMRGWGDGGGRMVVKGQQKAVGIVKSIVKSGVFFLMIHKDSYAPQRAPCLLSRKKAFIATAPITALIHVENIHPRYYKFHHTYRNHKTPQTPFYFIPIHPQIQSFLLPFPTTVSTTH